MHLATAVIQAVVRRYLVQLRHGFRLRPPKRHKRETVVDFRHHTYSAMHYIAARRIERWWHKVGTHYNFQMYQTAATELQLWFTSKKAEPSIIAATKIQHCYQAFINRRVYRYYRDLLEFQNKGDPKLMLRSINPGEAAMFDKATNVCVRFRLGGSGFPPNIYYKVFTRSAVCDIGAFAPRDYTKEITDGDVTGLHNRPPPEDTKAEKDSMSVRVGSQHFGATLKGGGSLDDVDQSDWYQRDDNNGWRSITAKTLKERTKDPVVSEVKKTKFHYSKLKRRENLALKRKRQKRKWMAELYRNGLIKEKMQKKEMLILDDDNQEELPAVDFDSNNWEEDADELLEWTDGLDFDGYLRGWRNLATSALTTEKNEPDLLDSDPESLM